MVMWEADPATILILALLAGAYAYGIIANHRWPLPKQVVAYLFGLASMVAVLTGPLDQLTKERSFFIYIFQQMVLIFVAPPLLILGTPGWMLRPMLLNRFVEPIARRVTRPLFAFMLFSAVFTLVHFPAVCDRICHVHPFYGDVHTMLLITGLLLWFPMTSTLPEYPRMTYPMQILYLFLFMIPMTAVAAPITMAETVLYTYYYVEPHPFGLTPMADQVLGGLIMWVGQGVYLMFVFSAIFFRWAQRDDQDIPPINRQTPVRMLHPQRGTSS